MKYNVIILFTLLLSSCSCRKALPEKLSFEAISVTDELQLRVLRNFDRLEEERYQPENVFLTEEESNYWPGDTEGRTILGLVLNARASQREPLYLGGIIKKLPNHLNELGYMGTIYKDKMNEQQLSGNGWLLRGLCEYYAWKKDKTVLPIISSIANNLFVKGKGYYIRYPIERGETYKKKGGESGNIDSTINNWMLSTDVGCVFIGMEGLIHAYEYFRTPIVAEVIEEMIQRFLQMDLVGSNAQTHASLTACRGLMRYAAITGNGFYADEAEKRWLLYKAYGMTENYENYNWFRRFDTWTEPCAVIDSYLLAVQLWQYTRKAEYRNDAELIYYNGICHEQRHNGGFGCNNCPGKAIGKSCLAVHAPEAYWCCTMRGGEGLSRAVEYSYYVQKDTIYVPFYHTGELHIQGESGNFVLKQYSDYPFADEIFFKIEENTIGKVVLDIPNPEWMEELKVEVNGHQYSYETDKGFTSISGHLDKGTVIRVSYLLAFYKRETMNAENTKTDQFRVFHGPLMLGVESECEVNLNKNCEIERTGRMQFEIKGSGIRLSPVYHLMDSVVWNDTGYQKQILFN